MIELPRDADGREIPLDTEVLYDKNGQRRQVDWFKFYPDKDRWDIVFKDSYSQFSPSILSLTKPDSWEKLEEDVQRSGTGSSSWFCIYAGHGKNDDNCYIDCKFFSSNRPCEEQATEDIVSRIRKLRGDGDA